MADLFIAKRIVGDLNRDCQLSPYETCLLGGNSQEVCDCVAAGGQLIDCKKDECEANIDFLNAGYVEHNGWATPRGRFKYWISYTWIVTNFNNCMSGC